MGNGLLATAGSRHSREACDLNSACGEQCSVQPSPTTLRNRLRCDSEKLRGEKENALWMPTGTCNVAGVTDKASLVNV